MMTIMFGIPAKAKIPNTENDQSSNRIEATIWNGLGNNPIAQPTTMRIRSSQSVTTWLLIENRFILGIERLVTGV